MLFQARDLRSQLCLVRDGARGLGALRYGLFERGQAPQQGRMLAGEGGRPAPRRDKFRPGAVEVGLPALGDVPGLPQLPDQRLIIRAAVHAGAIPSARSRALCRAATVSRP